MKTSERNSDTVCWKGWHFCTVCACCLILAPVVMKIFILNSVKKSICINLNLIIKEEFIPVTCVILRCTHIRPAVDG